MRSKPYRKWKRQLRELVELFLLPVFATLLPWRWSLRCRGAGACVCFDGYLAGLAGTARKSSCR